MHSEIASKLSQNAEGFIVLWVFSAAVSAFVPPCNKSSQVYIWFYRFLHLLAANLDRAGILSCYPQNFSKECKNDELLPNSSSSTMQAG